MKIAFGCDHAAYKIKNEITKFLIENGHSVKDFGCNSEQSCDYPDFAKSVAESVSKGENEKGILICGTGVGMSMAANKVKGIRAAVCWNEEIAKLVKEHNNANVLCLSARFASTDEIKKYVSIWLDTMFDNNSRHQKRIDKIMELDCK